MVRSNNFIRIYKVNDQRSRLKINEMYGKGNTDAKRLTAVSLRYIAHESHHWGKRMKFFNGREKYGYG